MPQISSKHHIDASHPSSSMRPSYDIDEALAKEKDNGPMVELRDASDRNSSRCGRYSHRILTIDSDPSDHNTSDGIPIDFQESQTTSHVLQVNDNTSQLTSNEGVHDAPVSDFSSFDRHATRSPRASPRYKGTSMASASSIRDSKIIITPSRTTPGPPFPDQGLYFQTNPQRVPSEFNISLNDPMEEEDIPVPLREHPSRFWGRDALPGEVDIGQELGDNAAIWEKYSDKARVHDKIMTEGWNGDMDVLLVFAALFSAILTAFIIEFYKQLQPDSHKVTLALLSKISKTLECIANSSECATGQTLAQPSSTLQAQVTFRWINTLWFSSLSLSLSVSAMAILVKQWIHAYYSGLTGLPRTYASMRQFRYSGIEKWRMSAIISTLPSVMYLAVVLFFAGLLILLSNLDIVIYEICLAISVFTGMIYVMTTILPIIDPSCPFRSPASRFFDRAVQVVAYYFTRLHRFIIRTILALLAPLWTPLLEASHRWVQRAGQVLSTSLNHSESLLSQKLRVIRTSEAEQEVVVRQVSDLQAKALIWLSSIHVQDTQEFVVQAIAGLSCETAASHFSSDSFKGRHWPASLLVEAYNNPNRGSSYHYELSNYAQAYLITHLSQSQPWMDAQKTQFMCNALQWYSALIPIGWGAGGSLLPDDRISQAISELSQALSIVTHLPGSKKIKPFSIAAEDPCFQIVIDLILQSILTIYMMYNDNSTIQGQVLESSFETLQIWMTEQDVLEQTPRPSYLLSLCSILQVFTGITPSLYLRNAWSMEGQRKEIWILLLKSLVALPNEEDVQGPGSSSDFRHWKLLHHTLIDCNTLLIDDRTTFDLVLRLFLKAASGRRNVWDSDHPFRCLHIIGPLLTPQDTVRVVESFERPWDITTGMHLCKFIQAQCRTPEQAQLMAGSDILQWLLDYLHSTGDFPALWTVCSLFQTLSKTPSPELECLVHLQVLRSINCVLREKLHEGRLEDWDYYHHWGVVFGLAATCYRLYRTYDEHILSTGIIITLNRLSIFAAGAEVANRKETQTFILTVLRLVEREKLYD